MSTGNPCRIPSKTKTLLRTWAMFTNLASLVHTAVCTKATATTATVITPFFAVPNLAAVTSCDISGAFANDHITLMDVTLYAGPARTIITTLTYLLDSTTITLPTKYIDHQGMTMTVAFNDHWYTHQRLGLGSDWNTIHDASCTCCRPRRSPMDVPGYPKLGRLRRL